MTTHTRHRSSRLNTVVTAAMVTVLVVSAAVLAPSPSAASSAVRPCSKGVVALTFDDGPRVGTTTRVLNTLAQKRVKATFFVVGSNVKAHPGLVRRAVRDGHQIGDHTYRHENLKKLSSSAIRSTLSRTDRAAIRAGAAHATLFRPPYGSTNSRVRRAASGLGMRQVLWTVDPQDWRTGRSSATIRRLVLRDLRDGSIVLMHDGVGNSGATATALPRIIDGARQRGFCFGTLSSRGQVVPPVPTLSISGATVAEGGPGTTHTASLTVRLSQPTSRSVSVRVQTIAGSATAWRDYQSVDRRVTISPGSVNATVKVTVIGDAIDEPTEYFAMRLSAPSRAKVGTAASTVRIVDDDPPPPSP